MVPRNPPVGAADRTTPWWRDAVVYQIYIRSFADSDGDGIGDLEGIRRRLDDIAALGVDAIWLNPCYPSPQRDHGYDVADYLGIEPDYGTLDDFDALVADANARGLRIVMDVVPNHCSDQHPWFQDALASPPGSPERARFFFRDGKGPDGSQPPNNWMAEFGGSSWTPAGTGDGQWYLGTFTPHQPDLNHSNLDVTEHFDAVLRFWADRGADGFRVDAVAPIAKAPDLPDAPPVEPGTSNAEARYRNPYLSFRPEGHDVWRRWRRVLDEYETAHPGRGLMMIAEAWTPGRPDLLAEYLRRDEYHQAFVFDLMWAAWHGPSLRRAISDSLELMRSTGAAPTWTLNNHDVQRIVTRLGVADADTQAAVERGTLYNPGAAFDEALGTRRARAALGLMLGLPGSVYLYAGEELGLPEVIDLPDEVRQDPVFHNSGGLHPGRDGARIPLPWDTDATTSFGFSPSGAKSPWLPQPGDWGARSFAVQRDDHSSMLAFYRRALNARTLFAVQEGLDSEVVNDDRAARGRLVTVRRGRLVIACNTGHDNVPAPAAGEVVLRTDDVAPIDAATVVSRGSSIPPNTTFWIRTTWEA